MIAQRRLDFAAHERTKEAVRGVGERGVEHREIEAPRERARELAGRGEEEVGLGDRLDAAGNLRTLVRRDAVVWADGVALAPDGALLFTDSAIPDYVDPLLRPPARGRLAAGAPYRLSRLRDADR